MAGFMTKLNGHVYEGGYISAAQLTNGVFAELNGSQEVQLASAAKDMNMRVVEKTYLWGLPAVVLTVTSVGEDEVYFVENEWDINTSTVYDDTAYVLPVGKFVRMHRPLVGEQMIMTVSETLYGTLTEGVTVTPAANGMIA